MSVVTSTGSGAKSSDLLAQRNARLLLVQCDSKGRARQEFSLPSSYAGPWAGGRQCGCRCAGVDGGVRSTRAIWWWDKSNRGQKVGKFSRRHCISWWDGSDSPHQRTQNPSSFCRATEAQPYSRHYCFFLFWCPKVLFATTWYITYMEYFFERGI